jgi:RNase_H superfamily
MNKKILYIDIEWKPATAYVWKMWDENISPEQLLDDGGLLCFCAHWEGQKEFMFFSEWEDGHDEMARVALQLLDAADAVVTYNGDKYDLPKLRGAIILAGLTPPPPPTSIDLIKWVKKFGFVMNRLAYIGPLLGIGKKMKHEGFGLWRSVLEGDPKAQARMKRYCTQDVKLLVTLYKRILPFIFDHPHLGEDKHACGACGSDHVQSRGFRRTKFYKIQRLQCQECGSWSTGTRKKV